MIQSLADFLADFLVGTLETASGTVLGLALWLDRKEISRKAKKNLLPILLVFSKARLPFKKEGGYVCNEGTGRSGSREVAGVKPRTVRGGHHADGLVHEDPMVDGKPNGLCVIRSADGLMVDGKPNGHWVLHSANGDVHEGPMVDGKMHGLWVKRFASGIVGKGPYVDDKRHGRWVFRRADGKRFEASYVDGKRVD